MSLSAQLARLTPSRRELQQRLIDEKRMRDAQLDAEPGGAGAASLLQAEDAEAHRRTVVDLHCALLEEGKDYVRTLRERERREAGQAARLLALGQRHEALSDTGTHRALPLHGRGLSTPDAATLRTLDSFLASEYKHVAKGEPAPLPHLGMGRAAGAPLVARRGPERAPLQPVRRRKGWRQLESVGWEEDTVRARLAAAEAVAAGALWAAEARERGRRASAGAAGCITSEAATRRGLRDTEQRTWDALRDRHCETVPVRGLYSSLSVSPNPAPAAEVEPPPPDDASEAVFERWLERATEGQLREWVLEGEERAAVLAEPAQAGAAELERQKMEVEWTPAKAMDRMAQLQDEVYEEEAALTALKDLLKRAKLLPAEFATPHNTPRRTSVGTVGRPRRASQQQVDSRRLSAPVQEYGFRDGASTPRGSATPRSAGAAAAVRLPPDSDDDSGLSSSSPPSSSTSTPSASTPTDDAESEDLAEAPAPAPSPRGLPPLLRGPSVPPGGAAAEVAPGSPRDVQERHNPGKDAVLQEQLRQERASRRNKWMSRAASYDDIGNIAKLVPAIDLKPLVPDGGADGSPGLDQSLSSQLNMERLSRANKLFAKSASLNYFGVSDLVAGPGAKPPAPAVQRQSDADGQMSPRGRPPPRGPP